MKTDDTLPATLDLLQRRRAPYGGALQAIVGDVLARFPPLDRRPVLEIGAGAGQLRGWLPQAVRARTVHSEPSRAAAEALHRRGADADVARAAAEALPIAAGACGGVLGLCVFDAVARCAGGAVAEIARVLAPGGRFVHLLDMATLLEQPFEKLAGSGLVPIPNVFGDPGDHEWPLDVVLLRARLAGEPAALRGGRRPPVRRDVRADLRAVPRRQRTTSPPRPTRSRRSPAAATGAARWPRC